MPPLNDLLLFTAAAFITFFADKAAQLIKTNRRGRDNLKKLSRSILVTLGAYLLLSESE